MTVYIYDGSFDGLLTALFYAYNAKEDVSITRSNLYAPSLLTMPLHIETEPDKAQRLLTSIPYKLSKSILNTLYYLYLSEAPDCDTLILHFLRLCYTHGPHITLAKNNDTIIAVDTLYRKVAHEVNRMHGFVRFKEIAPLCFYSRIEPDHQILPLIAPHFTTRFSDQSFIIHDSHRMIALVYTKKEVFLQSLTHEENLSLLHTPCQDPFEDLFKTFYTHTTIPQRMNPNLQKRLMPMRYWKQLIEV